ncbi:MAG: PAS domain S-box protein, partial [Bacteroidota bacterium]
IRHIGIVSDITERKQAEGVQHESERRFRDMMEKIELLAVILDSNGRVTFCNDFLLRLTGYDHNSVVGQNWFTKFLPHELNTEKIFIEAMKNGSLPAHFENEIVTASGDQLMISWNNIELRDADGHIIGTSSIGEDITQRRQIELALSESEKKYRGIFENVQDVFFETLVDGTILEMSPSILIASKGQYHREDLLGHSMFEFYVNEKERKTLVSILRQKGFVSDYEITLKNRDGSEMPCAISSKIQHASGDVPEKIIGSLRNIFERKETEKKIALLAHTMKSVSECVSITDVNDNILFVNNAFVKTYGYREDELLGKNITMLRSPNNPPKTTEEILAATMAGGWSGELLNRSKDGQDFPISLSTSYVRDENNTIVGLVGIAIDITEKRKFQQDLLQSQKIQSIGTLAGGIAHDFNNILGIILGYSGLLNRGTVSATRQAESIAAINQAVQRGASLVRQILTFARKTDVESEPVNLVALVQELISMLQQTFPKTIIFHNTIPFDIPNILADRSQIHQAILNLYINARDAMPTGGSININAEILTSEQMKELYPESKSVPYVCINVADTGEGMDEKTRSRIFDPFFTTKEQGKGTGLGLSVVFGIVQTHQGYISVESELGMGTNFKLYFPLQASAALLSIEHQQVVYETGGTETILVVEDEELLLDMVTLVLQEKGYTIIAARDGAEAVELYRENQQHIALVITDLGLPVLSGYEEFYHLIKINPSVKVILASGFFDPKIKSSLVEAGAKYFIQKPYVIDQFLKMIREVLDNTNI